MCSRMKLLGVSLFFIFILYSSTLFSAELNPADRNEIQQRQSDVIEQSKQQRDALQQLNDIVQPPLKTDNLPAGPCFILHDIAFHHSTLLTEKDKLRLKKNYINRCINVNEINKLIHDVSNWYIERGFITSRAFIGEQNLSSGILQIEILEGKLEKITINHQQERQSAWAFPTRKDDILNLRDIEQGMEQINRMPTQQVTIEILPGSRPGYSVVNLTRQPHIPFSANVNIDNSGQKSTGEWQLNGGIGLDNIFGIADQWLLYGGHSSEFSTSHNAENYQASVSLPYGYWNLNYTYAWSRYRNAFLNQGFQWRPTGDSKTHRLSVSRVVFRNGNMKTAISVTATHRIGDNYLNEVLLPSSSRKLSSAILGISHSQKLWGGLATFNPSYSRGTTWFGAEDDHDKSTDAPKAQFNKWAASASYYHPITDNISYLTTVYGQYSARILYGSEQVTLGGEASVRGFKEQYLSGNRGGYWRNEVNWRPLQLPVLGTLTFTAALDGGRLYNHKQDIGTAGTLWGAAVGISTANRYMTQQVTLGWPLSYPAALKPDMAVVYYRIGISL
ncbi:ShlB/FhaC/HecB family hemolysin secretion/activation protein [Prodigiosinella confusarubida]|uniref:ShlB/FhaC/HecB family hemolysin secretion/activation protein n=1 Tax=Serratia sp. (strain ATCC 39006) TaxID=104623 RepID=A0A2I5T7V6_SERS3|nr:ShlB/FhaC/HecB family hemolysin secretion/activation protein [Serratia sp. ATCC 39006]AUH00624.1 ShlB/FhaC/HecB family hemolysin secretion/activation protein [Serratia sp. ATCC 39006]AUH04945.1 ShlB/FhaC/HecB family hemolysin secretion/activation protein [Serratia sp. ATCC 39006]